MEPFIGEIRLFPWNWAPRGWHLCDGSVLPIQQFTALFSLLGTQYGGNGQTNFGLPDLRGRTANHFGNTYQQGEMDGTETVQLNTSQIPAHNHTLMGTTSAGTATVPTNGTLSLVSGSSPPAHYALDTTTTQMNPTSIQTSGGGQPHVNMQPYLVLNYCIAMSGLYPSRN